jgi:hypothetical protein
MLGSTGPVQQGLLARATGLSWQTQTWEQGIQRADYPFSSEHWYCYSRVGCWAELPADQDLLP